MQPYLNVLYVTKTLGIRPPYAIPWFESKSRPNYNSDPRVAVGGLVKERDLNKIQINWPTSTSRQSLITY